MSVLSTSELEQVRGALERQKALLLEHIRDGLSESEQVHFSAILGESSGDTSDEALATSLGDVAAARIDLGMSQFRELEAAAIRMESGQFGVCIECGKAIPVERLVANPAAQRCMNCQELHDKTYASQLHGSL